MSGGGEPHTSSPVVLLRSKSIGFDGVDVGHGGAGLARSLHRHHAEDNSADVKEDGADVDACEQRTRWGWVLGERERLKEKWREMNPS